ncbi:MAG TPA: hypothetical protein VF867_07445 [Arthrobacter sp.]
MKIIKRVVTAVPEPEPLPAQPSLDVPRLQQLIRDALAKEDTAHGAAALVELEDTYGSLDLAVAAVGATVQARAEDLAGITVQEIKAAHDRRVVESFERYEAAKAALAGPHDPVLDADGELTYPHLDEFHGSMEAHKLAKAGIDAETAEEMRRLIAGRLAAVSEIQAMGGEHVFAPGSDPVIVKALNDGSKYYPSAWLAISSSGREILATADTSNGGFYRGTLEIPEATRKMVECQPLPEHLPFEPDPLGDYIGTGEIGDRGREIYAREAWWVAGESTDRGADGKPTSGEAWEKWTHPTTGEVHWRYPEFEMRKVSEINVGPENPAVVAGMDQFVPVAVHEQAHRFEGVIENVEALEVMFLTRRTTLPDGTLEEAQPYYYDPAVSIRPDHFTEKYTGRNRYLHGATEVFSTGMEAVFAGQYGGFIGIGGRLPDAELQNFVLGVLVTCGGKRADF